MPTSGPHDATTHRDVAADQPFVSQSDAESWLGENWRALAAVGVIHVTLTERVARGDRDLYEMSLLAD